VKSARLPARIEPISSSQPITQAASIVIARSAASRLTRSSGAFRLPLIVTRLAATEASVSGCSGAIGQSEWNANGTPSRSSEPSRTIWWPRSGPSHCWL